MRRNYSEQIGIPSVYLYNMMERWERELCHVHSYMILKDGQIAAECYRYPYHKKSTRVLHSVSKTITALGIGFAVWENRLGVEDKVLNFFPEYDGSKHKNADRIARLTVENLLTMSVGHETDSIDSIFDKENLPWKAFLDMEMTREPGTAFRYDSGATYMLSAILTRVTGQTLLEYLKDRLFDPLGITDQDWDGIAGVNTGGWGCKLSVSDMAKIGQLLLMEGKWQGKQLMGADWIREMRKCHIDTAAENVYADWQQGYGYQMWQCSRNGCFRADGAFGQYILVCPPKNLVAVIWSEDAFSQDMLNIFWEELYDKVKDSVYGIDGNALERYMCLCREWEKPAVYPASYSYYSKEADGNVYEAVITAGDEEDSVSLAEIDFDDDGLMTLTFCDKKDRMVIRAGNTKDYFGETAGRLNRFTFIRFGEYRQKSQKYAAHYQWINQRTISMTVNWLETAHCAEIMIGFAKNRIMVTFTPSYEQFLIGSGDTPALKITTEYFEGSLLKKKEDPHTEIICPMKREAKEFQYPGQPVGEKKYDW